MTKFTWNWKLNDEKVNGATMFFSVLGRLVFLVLGILVASMFQPWLSFSQIVGLVLAYCLFVLAKTFRLDISDA